MKKNICFSFPFMMACCLLGSLTCHATGNVSKGKEPYAKYITAHYANQLTDPQKKDRKSFSQFGYGLYYFSFPLFPVTQFINPHDFGTQSYSEPNIKEKNGSLYTCRGGFMDFSHLRAAADWTVYLAFKLIAEGKDMELKHAGGKLQLAFKNLKALSLDDMTAMAQKIAFERLEWHEVASWHFHLPNYPMSEQQSTFTPEDTYSNYIGTVIGRRVAMRILTQQEGLSYEQITTEEIQKMITSLGPMQTEKESKEAYDIVDRYKQLKLPETERNKDVWWDSEMIFRDERYVFKRYINIGPKIDPWLVPHTERLGCEAQPKPAIFEVPQKASTGKSFYQYYTFTITPDQQLFFNKQNHKELHAPFGTFTSRDMAYIIAHIALDMEQHLGAGFDKRDKADPVPDYGRVTKVIFK